MLSLAICGVHSQYDLIMDRRRIVRELDILTNVGRVLAGVLEEVGRIPVERQRPELVAEALRCAALIDDPESFAAAPQAFSRLAAALDALHKGVDGD
jgi:hypothetical protein